MEKLRTDSRAGTVLGFRVFLKNLADDLRSENITDLKFVCDIPVGTADKLVSGIDVFKWLMNEGKLSENNLDDLAVLLNTIYRKDLGKKVKEYAFCPKLAQQVPTENMPKFPVSQGVILDPPSDKPHEVTQARQTKNSAPPCFTNVASPSPPHTTVNKNAREFDELTGKVKETEKLSTPAEPESEMAPTILKSGSESSFLPQKTFHLQKYNMSRNPRGICVVISNCDFSQARETNQNISDRNGTEFDVENIEKTFQWLQFDVKTHYNKTGFEIWKILIAYANSDYSRYDCFVCFVLSHGMSNGILGVDGKPVQYTHLLGLFNGVGCQTLNGKPKLFFFQACRGETRDCGMKADEVSDLFLPPSIPNESDFFIGYATPPGYVSWRSETSGTWYIYKICEVFREKARHLDLNQMMTMVNNEVGEAYSIEGFKQIPNPTYTLRKVLYFFPDEDKISLAQTEEDSEGEILLRLSESRISSP